VTPAEDTVDLDPSRCPVCGADNDCGSVAGRAECWCYSLLIGADALACVPDAARNKACLCRDCATKPVQIAASNARSSSTS
jgi:hypothetical protein